MNEYRLRAVVLLVIGMVSPAPAVRAQTLTTLYSFRGGTTDGRLPYGGVVYEHGTLYGTTEAGGVSDNGAFFEIDAASGAETLLKSFTSPQSALPTGTLIYRAGILYGTTYYAGLGAGTVFEILPRTGRQIVLYNFEPPPDGEYPMAGLTNVDGILYGTTLSGGKTACPNPVCGTVFKIDPTTGAEGVVHRFAAGTDGAMPLAGLIYENGTLYGTTESGGGTGCTDYGCGTVFNVDLSSGTERVIHRFGNGPPDGAEPTAGVIYHNGTLYGTTPYGGKYSYGSVFKVDLATGIESVIYSFKDYADGAYPFAGLAYKGGALYGTTSEGGAAELGTIFKINPIDGKKTLLHSFATGEGANPVAALTTSGAVLYGTTEMGGASNHGTVFQFVP